VNLLDHVQGILQRCVWERNYPGDYFHSFSLFMLYCQTYILRLNKPVFIFVFKQQEIWRWTSTMCNWRSPFFVEGVQRNASKE